MGHLDVDLRDVVRTWTVTRQRTTMSGPSSTQRSPTRGSDLRAVDARAPLATHFDLAAGTTVTIEGSEHHESRDGDVD
jgi:hypothetical protein